MAWDKPIRFGVYKNPYECTIGRMENSDLHRRLMEEARNYDASALTRAVLGPYRDVVLMQRARYMSYEQISATFRRHGIAVSPAAVGVFCRRHIRTTDLAAARNQAGDAKRTAPAIVAPALGASASGAARPAGGRKGPKIARDDY